MSCDIDYYIDNIAVDLAGRAAETILQNENKKRYTSGASTDLVNATATARAIVTEFGMMEEFGENMAYLGNYSYSDFNLLSDNNKDSINKMAEKIVKDAMNRATQILRDHIVLLDRIASELLNNEVLDEKDLDRICYEVEQEELLKN